MPSLIFPFSLILEIHLIMYFLKYLQRRIWMKKRDLLDAYLCRQYIGFEEERLTSSVQHILASNGEISIQDLSQKLQISRKTLLRLFQKHLAYSPSEYKSIVKFRQALNAYHRGTRKPSLAALAHEAQYYDQSDFNAHVKGKTGLTPRQLFAQIQPMVEGLYWNITPVPKVQSSD